MVVSLVAAVIHATPAAAQSGGASTKFVSLPVGGQVAGLAVGADAVWTANGRAGTVTRVDARTNQVVATIRLTDSSPTCDRCWGVIATRGDLVWAAMDSAGPLVVRIYPSSDQIAESIEVGVLPSAIAVGEDGALWLTGTLENAVVRVDPHVAGAVARTAVHLPSGVVAGPRSVWVTARKPGANGQVVRIDPHTGVVLASIMVGRDPGALAADEEVVWVANEADHTVSRIDTPSNTVVATIPVVQTPIGVAIGDAGVWVASRGAALLSIPAVSRIAPGSSTVVETTTIEGEAPIAMGAGAGSLWVASRNPDEVVRIGPVSLPERNRVVGDLPLFPVAIGVGTIAFLAVREVLRRSAQRASDTPVPDGRLLGPLLLRRQACRRAGASEGDRRQKNAPRPVSKVSGPA